MSKRSYDHTRVREYWQYVWERENAYELGDVPDPTYVLGMFPYTSGTLHMGHVRNYAITDAYARYRRMQGDDVLHPMGWDAFGLPAENAAYERYTDPQSWTGACIKQMREEMKTLGFGYDWSRELTTCEPEYYRWNQQFFREFYEAGLVEYEAAQVNWCPDCETVLADAQVVESKGESGTFEVCWRCDTPVGRRELDQWFFSITDYADELLDGLDDLDEWPDSVKEIQRNWIGKREGARVNFDIATETATKTETEPAAESKTDSVTESIEAFTTRVDTVYGATFLALSPGHELARQVAETDGDVAAYLDDTKRDAVAPLSGVKTDVTATHPMTDEQLPVYVAAYVLEDVGTGAVMGVPAHNERDHRFAREHDIPIKQVIEPVDGGTVALPEQPFTGEGMLVESEELNGLASAAAQDRLREHTAVEPDVAYRLRDWLISRQRYWGTPIPVVHCDDCGPVLVPEDELPVELPEFVQTTGNPLAANDEFVRTTCPECDEPARRETDTMDTFVDSSWYFLRYLNPDAEDAPFDSDRADAWLPVDVYVGGEEHAVLHLLYIRFFTRALADLGYLSAREPVSRLINQGTVLYDGEKMSKTKENVVSPHEYGAETTRLFVLSAAHPEQDFEWTARDIGGAYDLQEQIYELVRSFADGAPTGRTGEHKPHDAYLAHEIDRTIVAVTDQYEQFRFHRAVSEIRGFVGLLGQYRGYDDPHDTVYRRGLSVLCRLLAPMTPYLGEELWNLLRGGGIVTDAEWPTPESDVDPQTERRIVSRLRDDVRDIFEVAAIQDATEIEIAVAPPWKYDAYQIARETEAREPLIGKVMSDETMRTVGDPAKRYAESLQDETQLPPVLGSDEERAVLERAAWLLRDEFDAEVTVTLATTDEQIRKARPGRPAVRIR